MIKPNPTGLDCLMWKLGYATKRGEKSALGFEKDQVGIVARAPGMQMPGAATQAV